MGIEQQRYRDMVPGMDQVIQGGDSLVITDAQGQEISVTARESDVVMDFLKAFDNWLTAKNAGVKGVVLDSTWHECLRLFRNLPVRIQHELPSWAKIGVALKGHDHA